VPFFDEPTPPERRKRSKRLRRDEHGRPTLMVPSYLSEDVVLAVSDEVAVLLHGIACYPSGFALTLETTRRYEVDDHEGDEDDEPFGLWGRRSKSLAKFGIEYSDGRRATLDRDPFAPERGGAGARLAIMQGSGSGGGGHFSTELWVQPLPPTGPVTFAVEWATAGIGETLHTIDGQLFRDAAQHAKRVFPPRRRSARTSSND
jgi:hypothetical protein